MGFTSRGIIGIVLLDIEMRRYVERARRLAFRDLPGTLFRRGHSFLKLSFHSLVASIAPERINTKYAALCDLNFEDERTIHVLKNILQKSYFWSWNEKKEVLKEYRTIFSDDRREKILRDAEEICNHVFDFQGSGKKKLGKKISWRQDLATGCQWPIYKSSEIPIMIRRGSDIVRVWELSRFQWAPCLGKSYWITDDESYVIEFLDLFHHWCRKNPIGYGPNWITGQDAAIRAINWILTLTYIGDAEIISGKSWRNIFKMLYLHGIFIQQNLTIRYRDAIRITGNHYISELLGLFFLGLLFRNSQKGREWLEYSVGEIDHEMIDQVYPDGAQYESSVAGYHRFVLEHFLTAYLLFLRNDLVLSDDCLSRLEKMFIFVQVYTRPDGTVPLIGDTADARFFKLDYNGSRDKNSHLSLLYVYKELFGKRDLVLSREQLGEESFWLLHRLAIKNVIPLKSLSPDGPGLRNSISFPDSGFYFMKNGNSSMAISANPVGLRGKGNHKHNDILSFDLYLDGANFIVDPGSYVYTSDPHARDTFRSTAYHNTVMVDDQEINPFTEKHLFRMDEMAYPRVRKWESGTDYDYFEGVHSGYARLADPVLHERRILFLKKRNAWLIYDSILSGNENAPAKLGNEAQIHKISVFFHFAPLELSIREEEKPRIDLTCFNEHGFGLKNHNKLIPTVVGKQGNKTGYLQLLVYPVDVEITVEEGWISPSYGVKMPAPILRIHGKWPCPTFFAYLIST